MLPRAFPRRRIAIPAAVLLLLVPLVAALWVRADPLTPPSQPLDDAWLRLMDGPHEGLPWAVAEVFNHGADGRFAGVALLLFAGVLTALRRWRSALFALTVFTATYAVTGVLKTIGERARPEDILVSVSSNAFPSGHSSRMACVVVIIAVTAIPAAARFWWWAVGALLVLGMMWSRTWQHAHWLTDTVGGVATGLGVVMLCWWAFDPMLRRERLRRSAADGDGLARTGDARSAADGLALAGPPPARPEGDRCRPIPNPDPSRSSLRSRRPRTNIRRRTATRTRCPPRGPPTAWRSPRWSSASSGPATRSASSA
ncbi:phosphatase PAP2 family protein [Glycomyces tenuis]|uniref:phosphatase PAP2 family protein n=1 Tax=Glycomyces tenuis TaxID=58116 RepID=UPI0003F95102|nr:phosphatase PAP2 family protein [Glycomyces tenuis]